MQRRAADKSVHTRRRAAMTAAGVAFWLQVADYTLQVVAAVPREPPTFNLQPVTAPGCGIEPLRDGSVLLQHEPIKAGSLGNDIGQRFRRTVTCHGFQRLPDWIFQGLGVLHLVDETRNGVE